LVEMREWKYTKAHIMHCLNTRSLWKVGTNAEKMEQTILFSKLVVMASVIHIKKTQLTVIFHCHDQTHSRRNLELGIVEVQRV
jgi:hypothetical protein